MNGDDVRYMCRAVELAESAAGLASPNPTVGCVIVADGRVVGEGRHEYALMDHAEIVALRQAGKNAVGATVYVTLEPCSHHGRTPPCAEKLVSERVGRVVIAMTDPNPKVSGRGVEILRRGGIRVDVGTMEVEAAQLIEPFACHVTTGLPFVVGKAGMSVDGRIAPVQTSPARWITSPEGREYGQLLRLRMDAILVGVGTVLADNPELTYRGKLPKARPLVRVILDSRLRTPPSAKLFLTSKAPVLIFLLPSG
jgi:diaminohydroxyphosphoribosylaminopyrimidine deaminase/5-amino-6-(5-phosphoribosylamino)uracil reductase